MVDLGSLYGVGAQELVVGKSTEVLADSSGLMKTSLAGLEKRELVGGGEVLVLS